MTASQTKSGFYEVGYGKPPRHTQFRKGQSGNPGGRPRGRPAGRFQELALREAYRPVVVMEYGRAEPVPAIQAVLRSQIELAASGNVRAQRAILAMIQHIEQEAGPDLCQPVNGDDGGDVDAGNDYGDADDPGDCAGINDDAGVDGGTGSDPARPAHDDGDTDDDWRQEACERAAAPRPDERWREPPLPEPPPPPVVPWRQRPPRPGSYHRRTGRESGARKRW
jgi:uncharacterized protein DUF5681